MDTQIKNYTFNKTNKTITFTDYSIIRLDSIRLITNVTTGTIIYNFADPLKGGSVLNNVLTLEYNTSSMNDSDKLQIVYNTDELHSSQEEQVALREMVTLLKRLVKMSESSAVVTNQGIQRMVIESAAGSLNVLPQTYVIGSSMSNQPTAGAPANLATTYYQPTWSGPVDPRWTNLQNARIAYNTGIRSKLINT